MAVSTTDVVTNAVSGVDNIKNGIALVYCSKNGLTKTLTTYSYSDTTFSGIETLLTDRFDEVAYYFSPSGISGGGA